MLLAYLGPEATLPVTSAISALVGLVLFFGRRIVDAPLGVVREIWQRTAGAERLAVHLPVEARLGRPEPVVQANITTHAGNGRR